MTMLPPWSRAFEPRLLGLAPWAWDFLWCCVALQDEYVLYYYSNISVPLGRFQNRVHLVGDILHHDGSLLLQNVEETDQGIFTCEIRFQMESLVFKKVIVLHVLPEEPKGNMNAYSEKGKGQEIWCAKMDVTWFCRSKASLFCPLSFEFELPIIIF